MQRYTWIDFYEERCFFKTLHDCQMFVMVANLVHILIVIQLSVTSLFFSRDRLVIRKI